MRKKNVSKLSKQKFARNITLNIIQGLQREVIKKAVEATSNQRRVEFLSRFLVAILALFLLSQLVGCGKSDYSLYARKNSCSVVQTSNGAKIDCPDGSSANIANGSQGPQGIQGLPGAQGPQGVAGLPGVNGTNGSSVTFVKFCKQVTNYPSTFPEYGLCVDNKIFAVYSANGGFGVYLPPGTYSSNAINSSCTFTVGSNCSITN